MEINSNLAPGLFEREAGINAKQPAPALRGSRNSDNWWLQLYSITTPEEVTIEPKKTVRINSGVKAQAPQGTLFLLYPAPDLAGKSLVGTMPVQDVVDETAAIALEVTVKNPTEAPIVLQAGDVIGRLAMIPMVTSRVYIERKGFQVAAPAPSETATPAS